MLKSISEIEKMSIEEKKNYYLQLQKYCKELKYNKKTNEFIKSLIAKVAPLTRNYFLEIYGEENLRNVDTAIFVCNHSNSHDFFTIHETFHYLKRLVTPFGASDCLTRISKLLFDLGDVTLIDRSNKNSSSKGLLEFSKKIIEGQDGIIFSEGTWNLHPILPMQPLKIGGTQVAMITNNVIIPTVFEYVEVPEICNKEKELYSKCIVVFGKPIIINIDDDIILKTKETQIIIETMRRDLWKKLGIKKNCFDDINKEVYLNHTYLKKFDALGFNYNAEHEFQFLLKIDGKIENEYCCDSYGNFIPGITLKDKTLKLT